MAASARCTYTWSIRTIVTTAPIATAQLVAMVAGWAPDSRVALALYLTTLLVAVGAGCVACVSASQLAIHQAFNAGLRTGQASVWPDDPDHQAARDVDPLLRLVE